MCAGEDVTCKGKRRKSGKEKQGRAELGRCATRGYWKGPRHASYHNSGVMDVAGVAAWATGHEQPRAGSWLGSVQRFRQQLQRPPWLPSARAVCAHRRRGGSGGGRDTIALRSLIAAPAAGGPVLLLPPARCAA